MPHTRGTAHRCGLSHPQQPFSYWCFWLLDGLTPSQWGALKDSLRVQGLLAQDSTKCTGSPWSWTRHVSAKCQHVWHQVGHEGKQKHCACTMNLHVSQVAYTSLHPVLSFSGRSQALKAATSILTCAGEAQSLGRWVPPPWGHPRLGDVPCSWQSRRLFCCSFPEMPVDKPMESALQLSRHQPHSILPEISFVVEVGSVPWGGVICAENIIIAK